MYIGFVLGQLLASSLLLASCFLVCVLELELDRPFHLVAVTPLFFVCIEDIYSGATTSIAGKEF